MPPWICLMIKDLATTRDEIDHIDAQIVALFEKRMELVEEVIKYKLENNLEIFQSSREKEVIQKNIARLKNPELASYLDNFFSDLMNISKSYQATFIPPVKKYQSAPAVENPVVGYQGVPGSFSSMAMHSYFGDVQSKCYTSFHDVFEAIENDEIDYGILPLENSSTGAINDNYDLVRDYNFYIVGECKIKIEHNLLGIRGAKLEDINEVFSHPQGLLQTSEFLEGHPAIKATSFSNTAASAKYVSELQDPTKGAIASIQAGELYGLDVIARNIENSTSNTTRFIVVAKNLQVRPDASNITIIFTLAHEVGSLYNVLKTMKDHQLNLTRLESRPIVGKDWQYYFYIDFQGNLDDANVQEAISHLGSLAVKFNVIGNY